MKVLLIDADRTNFPNLALMKISAWHKKREDNVKLLGSQGAHANPDKVYISCVFDWNRPYALGIAKMFNCPVEVGGYPVSLESLPEEMEHIMPDYHFYGIHYSMGFTSRGCNRNCPWCVVPKKEGKIRDHATIDEFYESWWGKLRLLDNNFLQSPRWHENLKELIARKVKVDFNQGLDIRLVDQEKAKLLVKCRCKDTDFKEPRLRFAFDTPQIEDQVTEAIAQLFKAGIKPRHLFFYVLCGYNTTFEEDYHRFEVLEKLGILPFIMIYNNRRDNQELRDFARWVNQRHYKWVPWEKYDRHYRSQLA